MHQKLTEHGRRCMQINSQPKVELNQEENFTINIFFLNTCGACLEVAFEFE
jgi:hypothetical protein